jgi:peptidyl-prolyl cis-trans isomerase SurA
MVVRWSIFGLLLLGPLGLRAAEVLDRIVATVNGHVILQSDWDDELRFESFMSDRKLGDLTSAERKAAMDRLIDQELLHEQMRSNDSKPVEPELVQKQVETLKTDYLREHNGESWDAILSKYHLSEKFVESHIASELDQLRLVDARFRSSIQIDVSEIQKYYKQQLLPKLPSSESLTLTEASPKIREILVQEKMNELLSSWLETLRSQAQIVTFSSTAASGSDEMQVQKR